MNAAVDPPVDAPVDAPDDAPVDDVLMSLKAKARAVLKRCHLGSKSFDIFFEHVASLHRVPLPTFGERALYAQWMFNWEKFTTKRGEFLSRLVEISDNSYNKVKHVSVLNDSDAHENARKARREECERCYDQLCSEPTAWPDCVDDGAPPRVPGGCSHRSARIGRRWAWQGEPHGENKSLDIELVAVPRRRALRGPDCL